ncbi:DUF3316 domain-containing protein [Aliivibrio fischeri]|uniref:DUF3316 domain-containing protein n=1 Tax=Aliivibrio fischeri TaxID=668 RepID=UPI001F42A727|nr:DUF3316 domain-containing protein [Aliivibrio fischeri]MCE7535895.1 DUF3316 domain-containing protein [Aliivibrio fischeri]MCE7558557.1 DUF3316 domain-containing protein [Aliivibrio fischeri]
MKSFKSLALTTLIIVASSSSSAMANPVITSGNYISKSNSAVIHTDSVSTKQAAYNQALTKLNQLDESTPKELKKALKVASFESTTTQSIGLDDDSYITVQETMNMQGQIQYTGLIHAKYHYLERNSND